MTLHRRYVLALSSEISEGADDREYDALFALLAGTVSVSAEELTELASASSPMAPTRTTPTTSLGWSRRTEPGPTSSTRLHELSATRVADPRITRLESELVDAIRDQQPEAFELLPTELHDRRSSDPHGDATLVPLLNALVSLDDRWIVTAIDLMSVERGEPQLNNVDERDFGYWSRAA